MILMEIKFSCIYMFSIGLAPGTRANWTIWIFRQWDVLGAAIYSHTHLQAQYVFIQHTVSSLKTFQSSPVLSLFLALVLVFPSLKRSKLHFAGTRLLVYSLHTTTLVMYVCACVCFGSKCYTLNTHTEKLTNTYEKSFLKRCERARQRGKTARVKRKRKTGKNGKHVHCLCVCVYEFRTCVS